MICIDGKGDFLKGLQGTSIDQGAIAKRIAPDVDTKPYGAIRLTPIAPGLLFLTESILLLH